MREFGYLAGLKVLFESVVSSTALYSAGVWLGMTKAMYEGYDREQKRLLYSAMRLNQKTTFLHVCWELEVLPWSWGIRREKVSLVTFLCHEKDSQAGRIAVSEAKHNWRHGLVAEARKICQRVGLPDPSSVRLSAEVIGEAIKKAARQEMWESIVASRFVVEEVKESGNFCEYLYAPELSNHEKKIMFCYRLGLLEFKTRYRHKYSNSDCIYSCGQEDSLKHSLECPLNPVKRPAGDSFGAMLPYLVALHSEQMSAVGIPLYYL